MHVDCTIRVYLVQKVNVLLEYILGSQTLPIMLALCLMLSATYYMSKIMLA